MMRALGFVVGGLILLVVLFVAYILIWPVYAGWRDDAGYADSYFGDLFPYEQVLETKRWFWGFDTSGWGCTYAIVSLPEGAAVTPSKGSTVAGDGWDVDWQDTPAPPLGDTTRDAISSCAGEWDEDTATRIQAAMASEGSLFNRDRVGETVLIYSSPQRIAARIRYGD